MPARGRARSLGGPCRDGARLPRQRHVRAAGRTAQEPARSRVPGGDPLLPARVLEEEWEHHRYAVRDLDAIEAKHDA
jgi:hypothetical protein